MRIGVLLSGAGRTLENFVRSGLEVAVVLSDRERAGGNLVAAEAGLPLEVITSGFAYRAYDVLRERGVDLVCLAGFLRHLPVPGDFENRVINIHPSLLPSFGGKGMYGNYVHEAVLARGCKVSGCTVHFVDDAYDHGPIIVQSTVPVQEGDTVDTLADRVFAEECRLYPEAVRLFGEGRLEVVCGRVRVHESQP